MDVSALGLDDLPESSQRLRTYKPRLSKRIPLAVGSRELSYSERSQACAKRVVDMWVGQKEAEMRYQPTTFLAGVCASDRILTWGTSIPMTEMERGLHISFARGMGQLYDPTSVSTRPLYVVQSVELPGDVRISSVVTHPCVTTSTIEDVTETRSKLYDTKARMIKIDSDSSTGSQSMIVKSVGNGNQLMGRLSLSTLSLLESKHSYASARLSFVNMSSSSIMFVVTSRGACRLARMTSTTQRLLAGKVKASFMASISQDTLHIHAWSPRARNKPGATMDTSRDSHIKLSATGSLTLVGLPSGIEKLSGYLKSMLEASMVDLPQTLELMRTLKIVETHDTQETWS